MAHETNELTSRPPRIVLIAAMDRARAIGVDNDLPWRLPDDLQQFKRRTLNQTLLMGRRTAESLGRALPSRRNLVLTHSGRVPFAQMEPVASLDAALAQAATTLFAIGGASVFELCLPLAEAMVLTFVDTQVARADTWFPEYDTSAWQEIARTSHAVDARHAFSFDVVEYRRIRMVVAD